MDTTAATFNMDIYRMGYYGGMGARRVVSITGIAGQDQPNCTRQRTAPGGIVSVGGADRAAIGTTQLALNMWTHLAVTFDGTTLRLYVNGVQAGMRAQSGAIATSSGPLRIGGNGPWGEYFTGQIDDVRIHNRALGPAEIQAMMALPVTGS